MKLTNVKSRWDEALNSFYVEETYTNKRLIDLPGNEIKRVLKQNNVKFKL